MNLGYGFNMVWMVSTQDRKFDEIRPVMIDEKELDFIAAQGFNFIRVPLDYRFWIRDFRYDEPSERRLAEVDRCVEAVVSRGLHCSLNIHRAPGYCINRPDIEKHNLWTDAIAQNAFRSQWELFARRYAHIAPQSLSFDLLNEPPWDGEYGMTRASHESLMRSVIARIRAVDPERPLIVDGLGGGNAPLPELCDLALTISGRGYQPMALTHYRANWCAATRNLSTLPEYPGTEWDGKVWTKQTLRDYYAPWKAQEKLGAAVHIGEFGCFNTVSNKSALAWFADLLAVYQENAWGYSLWNFKGAFGIIEHGRPDTLWETMNGFKIDRNLLELLKANRIDDKSIPSRLVSDRS